MARPRPPVIEEFDDDTDLPLPSHPLANTGAYDPILEEIPSDEDDPPSLRKSSPGPASFPQPQPRPRNVDGRSDHPTVTDITPYKTYVSAVICFAGPDIIMHSQMVMYLSNLH